MASEARAAESGVHAGWERIEPAGNGSNQYGLAGNGIEPAGNGSRPNAGVRERGTVPDGALGVAGTHQDGRNAR
ncbi:hypothetical protein GCM10010448_17020 [Streptomyces glomeratus]|uniref:Uncharacterized protein n=1 Tax=Streptomyces glomeratus TaxID=284452 RepID=A0ABP6L927_9ACTN